MNRSELGRQVYSLAYRTGNFTLNSGEPSTFLYDGSRFESPPALLREIATHLLTLLPEDATIDYFAGLELGGVPIATILSQLTDIPQVFPRKNPKQEPVEGAHRREPVQGNGRHQSRLQRQGFQLGRLGGKEDPAHPAGEHVGVGKLERSDTLAQGRGVST